MVTGKKPGERERESGARVVRVLLAWQHGVPRPGG